MGKCGDVVMHRAKKFLNLLIFSDFSYISKLPILYVDIDIIKYIFERF